MNFFIFFLICSVLNTNYKESFLSLEEQIIDDPFKDLNMDILPKTDSKISDLKIGSLDSNPFEDMLNKKTDLKIGSLDSNPFEDILNKKSSEADNANPLDDSKISNFKIGSPDSNSFEDILN